MALVLGMNSGSSFDGIDVAAFEIELADDGHLGRPRFIDGLAFDWPEVVADIVLKSFDNGISVFELCRLNYVVGAVYATAALEFIQSKGWSPEDIAVIGVDGQTIYQEPPDHEGLSSVTPDQDLVSRWLNGPYGCGLQIGESAIIANHTDVTTVSHFRPADHALGGTGAPLMQFLDFVAFRDIGPVLTLNIGGIANCQLADADRSKMMAFDTGPGNVMIDHAARRLFGKAYDPDGSLAAQGTVDEQMLATLLDHDYFHREPPRSAWRLDFGADYAERILDQFSDVAPHDVMATLTRFTAEAVNRSLRDHVVGLDRFETLIASGGGTRNPTLLKVLAGLLPEGMRLTTSDEFGIPPQFKEAIKFGTLGYATLNGFSDNIPACSGATGFAVLGKIARPPRDGKLWAHDEIPSDAETVAAG